MIGVRALVPLVLLAAPGAAESPEGGEVTIRLEAKAPTATVRLGYSSPRETDVERTTPRFLFDVPEFQAKDPLYFRIALGETHGTPFYGALDRTPGGVYHDLLYLDRDRDLDLTNDGDPVQARVRTLWATEGKLVEFLGIELDLPYEKGGEAFAERYPCVFFYVLERKQAAPEAVLVERDGWREGALDVAGAPHVVAMIDDDSDGQFSTSDSWVVRPAGGDRADLLGRDATRSMLFPSWSKDQEWTVEVKSVDPAGRSATLLVRPAKETEREYFLRVARQKQSPEERRLNLDPLRPKAGGNEKVPWLTGKDVAYASDIADKDRTPNLLLLAFDAPNCRFCRLMDKHTFRDREIVQLSKRFVCAKIAFAPGSDDVNKLKVQVTPTYVILDRKGAEVSRHQGFMRPTEFAAWLKGALR